jgi:hypothetical protein
MTLLHLFQAVQALEPDWSGKARRFGENAGAPIENRRGDAVFDPMNRANLDFKIRAT